MSTNILNPFEIFGDEVLIMSFQTDKNGTFDPSMTIASGTLRWVIDGEEQITNSPSKVLTGSTVNVQVFANTVSFGASVSDVSFESQNIIGIVAFDYFIINALIFFIDSNPGLTDITFSASGNVSTLVFRASSCNLIGIFDLSGWTFNQQLQLDLNPNLTDVTFNASGNVFTILSIPACNLTGTIDLSSWTAQVVNASISIGTNPNLTAIVQPTMNLGLSGYAVAGCALPVAQVDNIFSILNTFFSANAPIKNLSVNTSGGTNASPTGGSSNTDLVNLRDVEYPNAGFTFTATIN